MPEVPRQLFSQSTLLIKKLGFPAFLLWLWRKKRTEKEEEEEDWKKKKEQNTGRRRRGGRRRTRTSVFFAHLINKLGFCGRPVPI